MSLISEFTNFISKGNILDLAVAFVIGAAFSSLVTALVTDIIMPIIGIAGHVNFSAISYTINGSTFYVGLFINAVISFITIALAIFIFVVKPIEKAKALKKQQQVAPTTKSCPYCIAQIPIAATRCQFCTSNL